MNLKFGILLMLHMYDKNELGKSYFKDNIWSHTEIVFRQTET